MAEKLNVQVFPTLFFTDKNGNSQTIQGYQPYEKFEEVILSFLPGIEKAKINTDPKYLFTQFNRMTDFEYAFLCNITKEESHEQLSKLFNEGSLDKYESKNGVIWISNFKSR